MMQKFTEGELEIMRILWEHGELKPPEIRALFPREIKDPALRSYLKILVEKGHVERCRRGKPYFYRARTPRESVFKAMYGQLVDTFFRGSTEALLCRLIKAENLSDDELRELRQLAEQGEDQGRREKPSEDKGGSS